WARLLEPGCSASSRNLACAASAIHHGICVTNVTRVFLVISPVAGWLAVRGGERRNSQAPRARDPCLRFCHNLEVPSLLRNPNKEPGSTRTRAGNGEKGFAPRSMIFAGFMRVGACSDFVTACGI